MTEFQKIRRKAVFDILDRFPDLPNMTTAKLLYSRYPELFNNLDAARGIVRSYRGVNGKKKRERMIITKYFRNEI